MLETEIAEIPSLKYVATALAQFSRTLFPGCEFKPEGKRWVARPHNFVTFEVHAARAKNITVTLRGNPSEFEQQSALPLKKSRPGHSVFRLTSPKELLAAAAYIGRAAELYQRGRTRVPKKPVTREV